MSNCTSYRQYMQHRHETDAARLPHWESCGRGRVFVILCKRPCCSTPEAFSCYILLCLCTYFRDMPASPTMAHNLEEHVGQWASRQLLLAATLAQHVLYRTVLLEPVPHHTGLTLFSTADSPLPPPPPTPPPPPPNPPHPPAWVGQTASCMMPGNATA